MNDWKLKYKRTIYENIKKYECRFDVIPGKLSVGFLVEIDKPILKFIRKCKRPKVSKTS